MSQEENHKNLMIRREDKTENVATFVAKVIEKNSQLMEKLIYKNYGQTGHKEPHCFELITYPSRWKTRNRGQLRGRSNRGSRFFGGG